MKDLKYYKDNCEEDYLHTPISVLRYITELEKEVESKPLIIDSVMHCNGVSKDVVSDKENNLEEHGCPYQEDVNGDYDFKCNCSEKDTHQCAMDI